MEPDAHTPARRTRAHTHTRDSPNEQLAVTAVAPHKVLHRTPRHPFLPGTAKPAVSAHPTINSPFATSFSHRTPQG
eukprot:3110840-Rhodomonas_salina.1